MDPMKLGQGLLVTLLFSVMLETKRAVNNLNLNLKKREHFQPLAPILLEEDFQKYFSINKSIVKNLEWMGTLCDAKEELYNKYSSIIHVDGTCRDTNC